MPPNDKDQSNAIVPVGVLIAKVVAMLLGLAGAIPGIGFATLAAGAGLGVAAEAADFASRYRSRRGASQEKRLLAICGKLDERLRGIEAKVDDEKLDLFVEVVRKAIEDDEAKKDPFYAAILDWIVRDSPNSARVRVLSDGVRQLSYVELFCFLHEANGQTPRRVLEHEGIDEMVWLRRLEMFGLGTSGVRIIGQTTRLGTILKKYTPLAELTPPNDVAKNPDRWR